MIAQGQAPLKLSRKEIVNFIIDAENKFPVDTWQMYGIDMWPFLRNALFLRLVDIYEYQFEPDSTITGVSKTTKSYGRVESILYYLKNRIRLKGKKHLLLSKNESRESINGVSYNKLYEYFLTDTNFKRNAAIIETTPITTMDRLSNEDILVSYKKYFRGYQLFSKIIGRKIDHEANASFDGYKEFVEHVLSRFRASGIQDLINLEYIKFVAKCTREFTYIFKEIIGKRTEAIYAVCYHTSPLTFAAMVCARELGIKSIDVQHGPANHYHLCYAQWGCHRKAYNTLPTTFWLWDKTTLNNLKWLKEDDRYDYKIIGEPWMQFVTTLESDLDISNYVLYTLQCDPHTTEELFSDQIIQLIKTSAIPWVIRRHPRQNQTIEELKNYVIENYGRLDNIYFEEYAGYNLPVLLANCAVHFTFSSGSAMEASFLKKPSIVVGDIAQLYFADYIKAGSMTYINHRDHDFVDEAMTIINPRKKISTSKS